MGDGRYLVRKAYRRTTCLCWFFAGCLSGLWLAKLGVRFPELLSVLTSILVVGAARKKTVMLLVTSSLLGLSIGVWRGSTYVRALAGYSRLYGKNMTVYMTAESDGVYEKTQMSFDGGDIYVEGTGKLPGKIGVKALDAKAVFRGDRVRVKGKFYKTRGSKQAGVSFAGAEVLSRDISVFDRTRLWFSAGVRNSLPEPEASFGIGLLIGQKTALPQEVGDVLSRVGLTHIIAVSGYNLTIIIDVVRRRLGKHSKYQTALFSCVLVGVFLLITGFSASIVRAAVVSGLGLWAWYYGRTVRPVLLVLCVAALTALWYPLYIWSDVGWYLSCLAFFGVLVIAPLLARLFARRASAHASGLITESLSAQLMTAPLIMYVFGRFSIIGFLSNLIVVPLVPIGMLLTVLAGICGMIAPAISGWVAWPAKYVLGYMIDCALWFSRWNHASVDRAISAWGMLCTYASILCCAVLLWKYVPKTATITDRNTQKPKGDSNVRSQ